jgi:large subunit ribosomal protein L12
MEYIHAALLLHKAGKDITESSVKKVLEASGVKVEEARVKALVSALKDVNIEEAISKPIAVGAPVAASAPAAKEEKKEEKKQESKEEDASAGLAALFG